MTFTVQSSAGVSLWGSHVDVLTARQAADAVVADLDLDVDELSVHGAALTADEVAALATR